MKDFQHSKVEDIARWSREAYERRRAGEEQEFCFALAQVEERTQALYGIELPDGASLPLT